MDVINIETAQNEMTDGIERGCDWEVLVYREPEPGAELSCKGNQLGSPLNDP